MTMDPLLEEARDGSEAAQAALGERFGPELLAYVERRLGPRVRRQSSAEDVAQDVLLRVFRSLASLPDEATLDLFKGRLFKNAQWVIDEHARRAQRFAGESAAPATPVVDEFERTGAVTRADDAARLRALAERLDPIYRDAILGRIAGQSFEEIAAASGENLETVRKRFFRAFHMLRERLGEDRDEASS